MNYLNAKVRDIDHHKKEFLRFLQNAKLLKYTDLTLPIFQRAIPIVGGIIGGFGTLFSKIEPSNFEIIKKFLDPSILSFIIQNPNMNQLDFLEYVKKTKFQEITLGNLMKNIIHSKDIENSYIIDKANLDKSHFYQILNDKRNPKRDTIVKISFAMQLNHIEMDVLLQKAGHNPLNNSSKRDAVFVYSSLNKFDLCNVNALLGALDEEQLI